MNTFYKERSFIIGASLVGSVLLVLAVFGLRGTFWFETNEATLVLSFENGGQGRMFTGEVVSGMTILEALFASSEAGNIKLEYETNKDNKITISRLDGYYSQKADQILAFYLNGLKIDKEDIHFTAIKPGDRVEVKLE